MCCRLQVVSTNVGGIPEVLPNDLILLAEPNVSCKPTSLPFSIIFFSLLSLSLPPSLFSLSLLLALVDQLEVAISNQRLGSVMPAQVKHQRIKELYNWSSVTERTIKVEIKNIIK